MAAPATIRPLAQDVVLLGRRRGLAALAGLIASFVVLLRFILPGILSGDNPLVVAVVGAGVIAFLAIYLAHGFGPLTTVALLGTLAALGVTVAAAQVFVSLADFSGFASEEAIFLNVAQGKIDLTGLTLAGIVIGALGAVDDMTVTQASVVAELYEADPHMSKGRLFASAMRVGRDHVASTVNTLALAYAGASMPLLVLFVLAQQSLGRLPTARPWRPRSSGRSSAASGSSLPSRSPRGWPCGPSARSARASTVETQSIPSPKTTDRSVVPRWLQVPAGILG